MKKRLLLGILFVFLTYICFSCVPKEQLLKDEPYYKHGIRYRSECCAESGGFCGCDRHSGMMRCCDGTLSHCPCAETGYP